MSSRLARGRWMPRTAVAVMSALALGGVLAGCAGAAGAAEPDSALIVRDGALRVPGTDCAGSAPYLFVHAGATLTVADSTGAVVTETALPSGTAVRSDDNDYGNAPRVPTFCSFDFTAAGLAFGTAYTFTVDGRTVGTAAYRPDASGTFRLGYPALGDPAAVQEGQ